MEVWQAIAVADETVAATDVLGLFNMDVPRLPGQIPCPVHGSQGPGTEHTPSARVYPDNQAVWCFTCGRQYYPTEVASANWAISRGEAAMRLLRKWPVEESKILEILRGRTTPRVKSADQALLGYAEDALKDFRGKSDLSQYRSWAERLDRLSGVNTNLPIEEQTRKVRFFVTQMRDSLRREA